jgi:hypothetical protein
MPFLISRAEKTAILVACLTPIVLACCVSRVLAESESAYWGTCHQDDCIKKWITSIVKDKSGQEHFTVKTINREWSEKDSNEPITYKSEVNETYRVYCGTDNPYTQRIGESPIPFDDPEHDDIRPDDMDYGSHKALWNAICKGDYSNGEYP